MADFNEIRKKFQFEFNPAISEYSIPEECSFLKLTENDKEMLKLLPLPIPFTQRNAFIGFDTSDECAFNWAVLNNEKSKKRNAEAATFIFKDKNGKYYTQEEPSWFGMPIYLSTPKDTFRVYVPGKGEDKLFMGNAK